MHYCNRECQRKGWKAGHRDECSRLRALRDVWCLLDWSLVPQFLVLLWEFADERWKDTQWWRRFTLDMV